MFDFKKGITSTFADESATITARGLGSAFASKASGPVTRGPSAEYGNDLTM